MGVVADAAEVLNAGRLGDPYAGVIPSEIRAPWRSAAARIVAP
jgi:hypothetical protein